MIVRVKHESFYQYRMREVTSQFSVRLKANAEPVAGRGLCICMVLSQPPDDRARPTTSFSTQR